MVGLLEPRAGVLLPERCIAALLMLARRHGAELRFDEPVRSWEAGDDGVVVTTARGVYRAVRLVLAAGPWTAALLPGLAPRLVVERQVLHWFTPAAHAEAFRPDRCPVALWEVPSGLLFYALPDLGDGVKLAIHHAGETVDPDAVERQVAPEEIERVRELARHFLPWADGPLVASSVCLYTNTPDHDFLIDVHPAHSQVIVASPCSGHGFKFASATGEVLADLAMGRPAAFDLAPFRGAGRVW
jgi:sarcosine oxidase